MSDFRKQLERVREEYRAARYPGDLAAELLSRPARRSGARLGGAIGITAAAAMIAIAVFVKDDAPPARIVAIEPPVAQSPEDVQYSLGLMPAVPVTEAMQDLSLAPPAYDFSMTVPSFSMYSDISTQDDPTTQETIL